MKWKRQYLIWLLLLLIVPSLGCQNCLLRLRGARCRPSWSLPSWRGAQPEAPCAPTCNSTGCGSTAYSPPVYGPPGPDYAPYVQQGSVITSEGVPVEQSSTGTPIETNRPIITSGMMSAPTPADTNVLAVPGPETGPLPGNR